MRYVFKRDIVYTEWLTTYDFVVEMYKFLLGGGGPSVALSLRVSCEGGPRQWVKRRLCLMTDGGAQCRQVGVEQRAPGCRGVKPLERVQLLHNVHRDRELRLPARCMISALSIRPAWTKARDKDMFFLLGNKSSVRQRSARSSPLRRRRNPARS